MTRRNRMILALILLLLQALPPLLAGLRWGPEWIFGGFLVNPIDGNSYLSKMQEGWNGAWQFTLLYSSSSSQGAFLFMFYIFLGHLARWLAVPLLWMFHIARILGCAALFAALARCCDFLFPEDPSSADLALWIVTLGSGLGWLFTILTASQTADFWVAEAYPFLSMLVNPHFPLGLAVLLGLMLLGYSPPSRWKAPLFAFGGLALAAIQPFAIVLLAVVLVAQTAWAWYTLRRFEPANLIWGLGPGGGYLLYQFWAIQKDPLLALWNSQNITQAPPVWDFLVSLSPALLLALPGAVLAWKRKNPLGVVLAAWLAAACILTYLPFNLQRRFMTGIYVPAGLLGVLGLAAVKEWLGKDSRLHRAAFVVLSLPTNLFLMLAIFIGGLGVFARAPDPLIYLPVSNVKAFEWLRANTAQDAVILATPEDGLFIPAWSGRKVVYGHPFETVNADPMKIETSSFFSGKMTSDQAKQMVQDENVGYIFSSNSAGNSPLLSYSIPWTLVYSQGNVQIFRIAP